MEEIIVVFRREITIFNGLAGLDHSNAVRTRDLSLTLVHSISVWLNGGTTESEALNSVTIRPDPGRAMHIGEAFEERMGHLPSTLKVSCPRRAQPGVGQLDRMVGVFIFSGARNFSKLRVLN